ncbi:MAG: glycogen synthase [Leptospirillia bacterium]
MTGSTGRPLASRKNPSTGGKGKEDPLQVFFLSSEVSPVAKTGGLADVSRALPLALAAEGVDVRIGTVAFRGVDALPGFSLRKTFIVQTAEGPHTFRLFEGTLGAGGVPVYALDPGGLFDRPGLYGERGGEYPDNLLRFSLWNYGLLALPGILGFSPRILHANDWQAALSVPLLPHIQREDLTRRPRTVLSVHNMAYQGVYPLSGWRMTGLPSSYNHFDALEFHGQLSLLKGGIQFADFVTTVSPSYRDEVLSEPEGFGLSGALRHRGNRFVGLLNGIDEEEWNPGTDPHLPVKFTMESLEGKERLKSEMRAAWGLSGSGPLFGVVSRMASQKGLGVLARVLLSERNRRKNLGEWVVLGSGDPEIEALWWDVAARYPGRVHLKTGFDEKLSHRIMGACDFLFVPSVYEPCGLTQMYAMRYGTLPIVNPTGGLRDTIVPDRTGLWLSALTEEGILEGIVRARDLLSRQKKMREMRLLAMGVDSSWKGRAKDYISLYREALALPPWHLPRR